MKQVKRNKINYGIDAPKVIRNLIVIGILVIFIATLFPVINLGEAIIDISGFVWMGICLILTGILMVLYSKFGKFRHRERILNKIEWNGDEKVLDVGTGLGLLMIGAAKRLTSGKSYGIDIFDTKDLSGNSVKRLKTNVQLEKVASKVEILNENILSTSFPDDYFDVIVSNLCLHNIPKSKDRKAACAEIYRIIKPEGTVLISDFKNSGEYTKALRSLGMQVQKIGTYFLDTFPPLTLIEAHEQYEKS